MKKTRLRGTSPWLLLLLLSELFFIFIVWLVSPENFKSVAVCIVLFTCLVYASGVYIEIKRRKKQLELMERFLDINDEESVNILLSAVDKSWHPLIHRTWDMLREKSQAIEEKKLELMDYQEFIEEWTHEIKTPLTVLTLVLENHKDDMSSYVYKRMEHVRGEIVSHLDKILYYARLQSDHVDYRLECISLPSIAEECISKFEPMAKEQNVELKLRLSDLLVICDRRVLTFMLSQLLSNAFKYTSPKDGIVDVSCWEDEQKDGKIYLAVRDNGQGAPEEDIPFLFDKGFTGSCPERQKATGMGLYLVKKYAEALSIDVQIESHEVCGCGFGIELIFPKVD
jgi:signal transduction histidine kinase